MKKEKKEYLEEVVGKFVDEYVMVELDAEKVIRKGKYTISFPEPAILLLGNERLWDNP